MKAIFNIVLVALLIWVSASFCDIAADNRLPEPSHFKWNFFVLLFEQEEKEEFKPDASRDFAIDNTTQLEEKRK